MFNQAVHALRSLWPGRRMHRPQPTPPCNIACGTPTCICVPACFTKPEVPVKQWDLSNASGQVGLAKKRRQEAALCQYLVVVSYLAPIKIPAGETVRANKINGSRGWALLPGSCGWACRYREASIKLKNTNGRFRGRGILGARAPDSDKVRTHPLLSFADGSLALFGRRLPAKAAGMIRHSGRVARSMDLSVFLRSASYADACTTTRVYPH